MQTTDIERWRQFAFDVLGFAEGKGPDDDALYLRMDERAAPHHRGARRHRPDRHRRLGGPRPRGTAAGEGRPRRRRACRSSSCRRHEADARRVEEVIAFDDPAGTAVEVFHGAVLDHSPVVTPFGARFVTGDQGLGHVVLPALDADGLFEFYTEVLGFRSRGAFRVPTPPEFGPGAGAIPRDQRTPPQPGDLPGDDACATRA